MASDRMSGPRVDDSTWRASPIEDLFDTLGATAEGLTAQEALRRGNTLGPHVIEGPRGHRGWRLLWAQVESPIVLLLIIAAGVSLLVGDVIDSLMIMLIVILSSALGFWQEHEAGRAVDSLLEQVRVDVEVRRGGREVSVPVTDVVPGDIVVLGAGDIVPGDGRLIASNALLVNEGVLTGESYPVEKSHGRQETNAQEPWRVHCVFMGTHVVSGAGEALIVHTGMSTEYGSLARRLEEEAVTTGFERGVRRFGMLLVRTVAALVSGILVVNLLLARPVFESVMFSLALAVGLTPQLLPAIVSVSLATGARLMAREKVIVRRLDAIEDFGSMTILCTDKTGTLTSGAVRLDRAVNLEGLADDEVLRLAAMNAGLQRGYTNPMDEAIVAVAGDPEGVPLGENPYDFTRRRLSVLVDDGACPVLVVKGAVREMLSVCRTATRGPGTVDLVEVLPDVEREFARLSSEGFRVLALATRQMPGAGSTVVDDESELTLRGLLVFHDPPKDGVAEAVGRLAVQGISVRLVTGDNRFAAMRIAGEVGLDGAYMLTGEELENLGDDALATRCLGTSVFAEMEPLHKERLVAAFQRGGSTVGFLGDGINDVVALHRADVGISVDTAVDAAKQTAAVVLLDKSLDVVADGVMLGRRTFANTLKYIKVTISANFGNMISMAAAAAFLPFLPLLPRQILLLNLVSDIPAMAIARDTVDPEQLARPQQWDIGSIRRFMVVYGSISSLFDLAAFAVLIVGFKAGVATFHSAWFTLSVLTELAVMLVLRTERVFFRSRPDVSLTMLSLIVASLALALPFTPAAGIVGLAPLPPMMLLVLAGLIIVYVAVNEAAKRALSTMR